MFQVYWVFSCLESQTSKTENHLTRTQHHENYRVLVKNQAKNFVRFWIEDTTIAICFRDFLTFNIFFSALQNPNACLTDVDPDTDPSKKYHLVLAASKENKIKTANNKPLDYENRNPNINDSSTNDAYDELLTQEEIQDHIDKINQLLALERIENYVKSHDVEV